MVFKHKGGVVLQKNSIAGIVAEYNPFHKGHAWMMEQLREGGAGAVVCVMSGAFVQRAQPALLPPAVRARAAVAAGADLVLRLPLPWAVASAERFAQGGVGLLGALGCVDAVCFGAEQADVARLQDAAAVLQGRAFQTALKAELVRGVSFAAARAAAAESLCPGVGELLAAPNNILGVEYCKALAGVQKAHGGAPVPIAIPRKGARHDGVPAGGIASASWLRGQVEMGGTEALRDYVPAECMEIYRQAAAEGEMLDAGRWSLALMARLRGRAAEDFARYTAAGEGLEARVAGAAKLALTPEELYTMAKSKRFAHSRVRRLCLEAALDIPREVPAGVPFAHVLAANKKGLALLKAAKETSRVPVSTSMAKLARTGPEAASLARLEAAGEDLYALCQQKPRPGGRTYTQPATIR